MKLKVYIQPNANRSEIVGLHNGELKIKIKAPPVDGEANQEIIQFLADFLDLPKRNIILLHGSTGRHKLIHIDVESDLDKNILKKLKI